MTPTVSEAFSLFYPAANAAYGSGDPAHLVIGNNFSFEKQIAIDPVKAAQIPLQHLPLLTSMLKMNSAFGYVARAGSSVMVAFRGTETPEEWLCDFEAFPASCDTGMGGVHEGFQRVYNVIQQSALQGLAASSQPGDQILITGHSLGAALAVLFAADISKKFPTARVCTFAGPRIGLQNFVQAYNQALPATLRVVNRWDIVPNVPVPAFPLFGYEHVGQVLSIDGGFTFDLKVAHSLPLSYMPGLKKLAQPQVQTASAAG